MRARSLSLLALAAFAAACADSSTTAPPPATVQPSDAELFGDRLALTAGQGQYGISGTTATFAFSALRITKNTSLAIGSFKHSVMLGGQLIEFEGRVTCVALDEANRRAWIAGVVTKNNSTHPSFTTAIHQVGRDVWFRVVDYGHGSTQTQPDRLTFLGFEGGAGIITSAEYCATKPWPDNDDRTNAVTSGGLAVR